MNRLLIIAITLSTLSFTSCAHLLGVAPPPKWRLAKSIDAEKGSAFKTVKTVFISPPIAGDRNSISYLVYRKPSCDEYTSVPVGSIFRTTKANSHGSYNNGYFPVIYGDLKTSSGVITRNVNFTALLEHRYSRLNNRYYRQKDEGAFIKKL